MEKAEVIERAEAAGEAYAADLLKSDGLQAMADGARDWMAECVALVEGEKLDVAGVPLMMLHKYVQVFARGADRYATMVRRGFDHESIHYPTGRDLFRAVEQVSVRDPKRFSEIEAACIAANPSATTDDVSRAVIDWFDCRAMGDRPALLSAYAAGAALARKAG